MPKKRPELEPAPAPWQRVESTLMTTARLIRLAYDECFADVGLNLTQATMLLYVAERGPQRQTRLAERLGLGRAATGVAVDQLESRGLVERVDDPEDRRAWLVKLTAAGKDLIEPMTEIDRVFRQKLRKDVARKDRQKLARVLLRLQDNLAEILAERNERSGD